MAGLWLAALAAVSGCSGVVDQRGNLPDTDRLAQIQPGQATKDTVTRVLGTPSSISTFDPNTWYYISRRTEQFAFLAPELLDQQVLVVEFDANGVVKDMRRHGKDEGQEVALVDRTTPAPGRELSLIEQLIGNFGKFSSDTTKPTTPGGRR
jgi:outer membrane protein assembly factor BamE (lipoprotein component of BamABCDE complex)